VPLGVTVVLWLAASAAATTCKPADAALERAIAQKARELRGIESCEHRHTLRADCDGDGVDDQLVLFAVEPRDGGNRARYFLAVLPSKRKVPALIQAGAPGTRIPEKLSVDAGRILVYGKEYGGDDPPCCPGRPGRLVFKLEPSGLVDETASWTLPGPPAGQEEVAKNPGLSKDEISGVVHLHLDAVKRCYEAELAKHADLEGEVDLTWTIAKDGHVESAAIARSRLGNDVVPSCIVDQVRRWAFSKAERPTTVGWYPFLFRGSAPDGAARR
jgi:hypothetical protein